MLVRTSSFRRERTLWFQIQPNRRRIAGLGPLLSFPVETIPGFLELKGRLGLWADLDKFKATGP